MSIYIYIYIIGTGSKQSKQVSKKPKRTLCAASYSSARTLTSRTPPARRRWTTRRFPAPDHETPTNNGALEYLLDDHLPVFWKRLFALTFARLDHAVLGDEYLARHLGSFLVGDDLLR